MASLFAGIDVGTQGVRCLVVDPAGRPMGAGEVPFSLEQTSLPEGWREQEPRAWVVAVRRSLAQALGDVPADRVAAVGVTSTSGTLCVLDSGHAPIMPAIMYNDRRSRREAEQLQRAGIDLTDRLGYRFSSSFGLPKILWVKQNRPEVYGRARLFTSPTDYVIGWLTHAWGRSDQTNMLKFGYDLLEGRWPRFIEEALGLDASRLPRVQKPGEPAGRITRERAAETGLPHGIPVVAGMTDGCASQVSSGAVAPGLYNTTIGTTLVIKGVSEELLLDPVGRIYCHRHPAGWWLPGGASNTGAECLAAGRVAGRETGFGPDDTEALSNVALDHSPTDLTVYPLVGTGERFPFRDPEAEGFVLGSPEGREQLFAGCLEGVACLERLAYETLADIGARVGDTIYSAGGGAAGDSWLQIRADTMDRTVLRPALTGAAMGAAILAASHERYADLPEAARAMVRIEKEVQPRAHCVDAYGQKYEQFVAECAARGYVERGARG